MSNEIFNLVKSIVGAGVLSLSAGIAAFGDAPSAVIPANILIAVIGGISGEYLERKINSSLLISDGILSCTTSFLELVTFVM